MNLGDLKARVCAANLELNRRGVVLYTWGNVSEIDRAQGVVAIKPSGVSYDDLTPEAITVVDMAGQVVDGKLNPSTDTATHLALYKAWPTVGGVVHTHSTYAVAWAQARRSIPCFGTTHADHCHGAVPCTAPLSPEQVARAYEEETGLQIVKTLGAGDPLTRPMALVAGHGPFTWGKNGADAVKNAVILEEIARIASITQGLTAAAEPLEDYVLDYHHQRKHGPNAWYGQKRG